MAILVSFRSPRKSTTNKFPNKNLPLKIIFKSRSKEKNKLTHEYRNIKLNDLAYSLSNTSAINSGYQKAIASKSSEMSEVYNKIKDNLAYPQFIKKLNISGVIKASLYFNKNGKYLENVSRFDGNNFLKVTVSRSIRKSFQYKLLSKKQNGKGLYVECFFDFRLVTDSHETIKSKLYSNYLYFYKSGYGGERGIDYFNKTVSSISNIFSLLKYLPSSKKNKQIGKRKVEDYKRDPAWR